MRYMILKDFRGSQTGSTVEDFKAGTEADLSDYLASCVDPAWVRRIDADVSPAPTSARRKKTSPPAPAAS